LHLRQSGLLSGGVKQIIANTVDFGASDAPLADDKLTQEGLFQFEIHGVGNNLFNATRGTNTLVVHFIASFFLIGVSPSPLADDKLTQEGLFQFPTVIGGVVLAVNLPGVKFGNNLFNATRGTNTLVVHFIASFFLIGVSPFGIHPWISVLLMLRWLMTN
jgi:hypothetical protein